MDCEELREQYLNGEAGDMSGHSQECDACREWLTAEGKLEEVLKGMRGEADNAVAGLAGRLRRPDRVRSGRILRAVIPVAVAAAFVMAAALFIDGDKTGGEVPELMPTKIVVIQGRVRDDSAPPEYVEVDGQRFDVKRVSATEGVWEVEVETGVEQKSFVLSAVDHNGNRAEMRINLHRKAAAR